MTERTDFEAWAEPQWWGHITAWKAWQAATALERARCAKVVDDLCLAHPGRADLTADQCAAAIRKGEA
jgi:hypothetical protein